MYLKLNQKKYYWSITEDSCLIVPQDEKSDTVFIIEGKNVGSLFKGLEKGIEIDSPRTDLTSVIENLLNEGVLVKPDEKNKKLENFGFSEKVSYKKIRTKDLIPSEINSFTVTAGECEQAGAGVCVSCAHIACLSL